MYSGANGRPTLSQTPAVKKKKKKKPCPNIISFFFLLFLILFLVIACSFLPTVFTFVDVLIATELKTAFGDPRIFWSFSRIIPQLHSTHSPSKQAHHGSQQMEIAASMAVGVSLFDCVFNCNGLDIIVHGMMFLPLLAMWPRK